MESVSHKVAVLPMKDVVEDLIKSLGTKEELELAARVPGMDRYQNLASLVDHVESNPIPAILRQRLGKSIPIVL